MKRVCILALLGLALLRTVEGQCRCKWVAYSDEACKTAITQTGCVLPRTGKGQTPTTPLTCQAAPLIAGGTGMSGRKAAMYSIIGSSCLTVRVFWDEKTGNQQMCPQDTKALHALMYKDVKDGHCWRSDMGPGWMGNATNPQSWTNMCGGGKGKRAMSFKMDCGGKQNRQSKCDGKATDKAPKEDCDTPIPKSITCASVMAGGDQTKQPGCVKDECFFDLTPCSLCGNKKVDPNEECDASASPMFPSTAACPQGGQQGLACTPMCTLNTTGCGSGTTAPMVPMVPKPVPGPVPVPPVPVPMPPVPVPVPMAAAPVAPKSGGGGITCDSSKECDPKSDPSNWKKKCPDQSTKGLTCNPLTCTVDDSQCPKATSPVCGDGKVEGTEQCDPKSTDKSMWTVKCPDQSVADLKCDATSCMVDTNNCPKLPAAGTCGDGKLGANEECDPGPKGMNLPPQFAKANMCDDGGMLGLVCKDDCKVDKAGCKKEVCSVDGTLSDTELCDGDKFHAMVKCYDGTTDGLKCTDKCKPDMSGCSKCGNGVVDTGDKEECDPMAPPATPKMCTDSQLKLNFEPGKAVPCSKKCKYDWSMCKTIKAATCGATAGLQANEMCDYDGDAPKYMEELKNCELATGGARPNGDLKCTKESCAIDTSGCKAAGSSDMCGNKKWDTDAGEECDGSDEKMKIPACTDLPPTTGKAEDKFKSGTITCTKECKWDISKCSKEAPSDDKAESSEEEGNNMMLIVGGVVGVAAIGAAITAGVMMKKKKAAKLAAENAEGAEEEWDAEDPEGEEAGEEFTTEMEEFGEAEEGDTNYDDFGYDETGE